MSNADWWAKQLGTQPQVPQSRPVPVQPQQPQYNYPPIQQPPQAPQPVAGARSASQTDLCPDCGSDKYMSVQGAKPRCMECGYPVEQSGSKYGSLAGAKVEGNAKGALGNDATNNYNPQTIIGRI